MDNTSEYSTPGLNNFLMYWYLFSKSWIELLLTGKFLLVVRDIWVVWSKLL